MVYVCNFYLCKHERCQLQEDQNGIKKYLSNFAVNKQVSVMSYCGIITLWRANLPNRYSSLCWRPVTHTALEVIKCENAKLQKWHSIKCESGIMRKRRESMYKAKKWKCEKYVKSSVVYSSAYLWVTLAYVVVNLERVAECPLSLQRVSVLIRFLIFYLYISWTCFCCPSVAHQWPVRQIFRIGTARYAEGLWRMRRHRPVIAHCTDSEDFPPVLVQWGEANCLD